MQAWQVQKQNIDKIDGLVQERHNSTANALELRLSVTKPSIYWTNKISIVSTLADPTHYHRSVLFSRLSIFQAV